MKKICFLLWALTACLLSSCFEDDGNYNYTDVPEITIEGMGESHTRNSYAGEVLTITPTVTAPYTDLEYEWYLWDREKELQGSTGWEQDKEEHKAELIGTDKDLAYEVNCPPGKYTVMLKVRSASSGYFNMATVKFEATTLFRSGFYILKETPEGNTELDLYNANQSLIDNVLAASGNGAMQGKPLGLGALQSHSKFDGANQVQLFHSICVTTESNQVAFYNTNDMSKAFARDILPDGLPEDEMAYTAFSCGYSNYFLTSNGCYTGYVADMMPGSGMISVPSRYTGGSTFVMFDGSMNVYYWCNETQRIDMVDNIGFGDFGTYNENGFSTTGMTCRACGFSKGSNKGIFLLKDSDGKQYFYEVDGGAMQTAQRFEIPAGSKLASATAYAVNANTSYMLYYISGNQFYTYNLTDYSENPDPVTLPGIGAGETITYLSYQWQDFDNDEDNNFTCIVVGTQKGDDYKLYLYDIEAGMPKNLVKSFGGQGKLKMCVYMSSAQYNQEGESHSLPN